MWLRQRFEGILDNVMAQGALAMISGIGFAIWATIKSLPGPIIALIGLWAIVGVFLLLMLVSRVRRSRNVTSRASPNPHTAGPETPIVIPSRQSMAEFRSNIEASQEVWACWIIGGSAQNYTLFNTGKISRLMLIAPDNIELPGLSVVGEVGLDALQSQIRDATRQAQAQGTQFQVRWWKGHVSNMITIGNPNAQDGWCRVETFIPLTSADHRTSVEWLRSSSPKKYQLYLDVFLRLWEHPDAIVAPRL